MTACTAWSSLAACTVPSSFGKQTDCKKFGWCSRVHGNAMEGGCVAATVGLCEPIPRFNPAQVKKQLGVVELFRVQVRAVVAVPHDG